MDLWWQFIAQNLHFAVNVLAGMTLLSVWWLYVDAWWGKKKVMELWRIGGFLLLALAFLAAATQVETVVGVSWWSVELTSLLVMIFRILGLVFLLIGLAVEPIQPRPKYEKTAAFLGLANINLGVMIAAPMLTAGVALMYWRRATIGLEKHISRMAGGFIFVSLSLWLAMFSSFRTSSHVWVQNLVKPFGVVWFLELFCLLVAAILMLTWVWHYLLLRLHTQLMLVFTSVTLVIFLVTTLVFSGLLLRSMERATLERLASDAKIMKQSFISLQRQLLADGRSLALDPEVVRGVRGETVSSVSETAQRFLASRELSSVVILNEAGKVLVRGEEPDRVGESLSAEPLFVQAVKGEELVTVVTRDEPTRQSMWIYALAPVVVEKQVVGVVMLGQEVGQSMLDGVKASTGLEGALWSGNKLAAATFAGADTAMGIVETRDEVVEQVLTKGESIAKPLTVLSVPYFVAYEPIRDDDDVVVGMLSVGTTQAAVFQLAGESTALTFVVAIGLMLTMSGPSYWVARQLAYQLH